MDVTFLNKISENLKAKRHNLQNWLQNGDSDQSQIHLGTAKAAEVVNHIQIIDQAIAKSNDQTLGICSVCHDYVDIQRLEMDYTAHVCLDHLSPAEARRLEDELEMSQTIHKAMLPQHAPEIPGMDFAVFSRPAEIIGGDFFDFLQFHNGAQGLAIADVAGHGMSSGILMASLQMGLRTLAPAATSPADVVSQLHKLFIHNIHFTTFVTLFLGALDLDSNCLSYCNAGHNPPLIFNSNGTSENQSTWLTPTGPSVGLIEEARFKEKVVQIQRGDLMLLYTDGVTEAINPMGMQFGKDRLASYAIGLAHLPAKEIVHSLRKRLREFTEEIPLEDDTTILICRFDH